MAWPPMVIVCCVVEILSAGGGACRSLRCAGTARSTASDCSSEGRGRTSGCCPKSDNATKRDASARTRAFMGAERNTFRKPMIRSIAFAAIALLFGAAYALRTPAFEVPDEVAHYWRATAAAYGHVVIGERVG